MACICFGAKIQIYMPREVKIDQSQINLEKVCIITGDIELAQKAAVVSLGALSIAGQETIIDRDTIISRLVSNGIKKNQFEITGSMETKVKGESITISAAEYIKTAESLMKEIFTDDSCKWQLQNSPQDTVFEPDGSDYKLQAEFDNFNSIYQKRVIVKAVKEGGEIDRQYVIFQMKYKNSEFVAVENIARGQILTQDNIRLEYVYETSPNKSGFVSPYGMAVKKDIAAGEIIRSGSYQSPKPQKIIKRNEVVIVNIETEGFKLAVPGEALQDGFENDLIKVKVQVTQEARTIIAKVKSDGTVEPII